MYSGWTRAKILTAACSAISRAFTKHAQRRFAWSLCSMLLAVAVACAPSTENPRTNKPNTEQPTTAGAQSESATAVEVVDDAGLTVRLAHPAQRIISLIPSATETLIAIGAVPQIVGRTRYDVAPEVMNLPSVGGGIDASVEAIAALQPDLVVGWESDKRQLIRSKLVALNIPMFILRTQDTTDVFRGLERLSHLTGHDSAGRQVLADVRADLNSVRNSVAGLKAPSVFYVVFNDPPMTAGPNTFIGQLISLAGGRSIFGPDSAAKDEHAANWPNVGMEEIVKRDPDIIVVPVGEFKGNSLERYRTMQGWRTLRAVRTGNVVAVPSDLLSRPSPNIGRAAHVLRAAFHPQFRSDSTNGPRQ